MTKHSKTETPVPNSNTESQPDTNATSILEIFWRFLTLGCVSFGGPAAHMGYFQNHFVEKLRWLSAERYAQLIALSQFLPGPGSSQVGFALGVQRGGLPGGLAAFIGFTFPSFVLMYLLASQFVSQSGFALGVTSGLKLLAVVVVADATLGMAKNFCQNRLTMGLAAASTILLLCFADIWLQLVLLIVAAGIGARFLREDSVGSHQTEAGAVRWGVFAAFAAFLLGLPLLAGWSTLLDVFADFYQAGSLVFGGGHVVLPLLQELLGSQIETDRFLTGYAAAQAVPGPMFTMATFLGAEVMSDHPLMGAVLATLGIFLPGLLLVYALLPAWQSMSQRPLLNAASKGVNAAVVGLLAAALYQPVFQSAVHGATDMALVVAGLFLLRSLKLPVLWLVLAFAGVGGLRALF